MPNGFANNNLFVAGITNFYFSTIISVIPGQTYYIQPVVLSGDDPWDVVTIGDTYSNGQLFGKTGGYFQPSTDLWFREGIVVPEPAIPALVGMGLFLLCFFKRRYRPVVLLIFVVSGFRVYSAPDSVAQITSDAAGLTLVSATDLPRTGTFWVLTPGIIRICH